MAHPTPQSRPKAKGSAPALDRWGLFTVDVELTNRCTESCVFCPRAAITRPRGEMPQALAERLARTLRGVTSQVTFSGMGDPLRHPDIEGCVAAFRDQGIRVGVQVSAAALDNERIARLVGAAPHYINLSLPSAAPEVLARLVPGCDPQSVLTTVDRLAVAGHGRITVTLIGTRTALEKDDTALARFGRERGLPVRVFACHSRGGAFRDPEISIPAKGPGLGAPCGLFARHGFVTWQGDLLACCHDLTGETRIGSFACDPITDLLAYKTVLVKEVPPFPLCESCDESLRKTAIPDQPPPATKAATSRYLRSLKPKPG